MKETKEFTAEGMICESCEKIIKKQAMSISGVHNFEINYRTQKGKVTYDSSKTKLGTIFSKISEKGYSCSEKGSSGKNNKILGWIFGIIGIFIAFYFITRISDLINLPDLSQGFSYGLLFVVGLVTGFHCISMCGGFVISYTAKNAQEKRSSHLSHLFYGGGKTISYTIIGAIFGLIGSVIAFTPTIRGVLGIIAGIFLAIYGINMLGIFPFLRKLQFRSPKFVTKFVGSKSGNSGPLVTGLLNGLMLACGPLQALYIMAAGTGSMLEGAKILFIFGLGTLPIMLGFGYFASYISTKMTQRILKASGVIVLILGLIMLNRGLALTGTGYDVKSILPSQSSANANLPAVSTGDVSFQEIRMDVTAAGWSPDTFVLKKGVPVHWIVNGKEITSCNKQIQVPKLGIKFDVKPGEQVINFTPTEDGTIPFSCWMGMIQGTFIVKDSASINNTEEVQKDIIVSKAAKTATGSCSMGGSGGGCGCGMM